jgi:hypothetical protein
MTKGTWARMTGIWGAAATQKAAGAMHWEDVDGVAVPTRIIPGRVDGLTARARACSATICVI